MDANGNSIASQMFEQSELDSKKRPDSVSWIIVIVHSVDNACLSTLYEHTVRNIWAGSEK